MSGFIRLIGSMCMFVWITAMFFGDDFRNFFPSEYKTYADDLIKYKWPLLVMGIILSIFGTATKIKQRLAKAKLKSHSRQSVSGLSANHNTETSNSNFVKKDFIAEKNQHKVQQLIDKQQGHLKELALKVEWKPLAGGGANFKTTSLKQIKSSRLEVIKSTGGLAFSGLFAAIGIGVAVVVSYFIYKDRGLDWDILFTVVFGSIFAAAGIAMMYWPRPRVFDLRYGWFWAGNKSLSREQDFINLKKSARLSEIAVIQIIAERITSKESSSYTSWEINLVSNNGDRLNVMDHGNQESIVSDAQLLGEFLGVPVWENT